MYQPEPHEVQALADQLVGDLMAEPDPTVRYHALTREQALLDGVVSEIKRRRGAALAELRDQGMGLHDIADAAMLGNYQKVQKLIAGATA